MKVLVTGSTGLVGTALTLKLRAAGHQAVRLVRKSPESSSDVVWAPMVGVLDRELIEGIDAAVHLAGENIFGLRWTEGKKAKIRDSRVKGTRFLAESLAGLKNKPKALICASAVGFYGDRGEEVLTEQSPPGRGFLADVCREWEAACDPASQKGIRVVNTRFGIILTPRGGALRKMLPAFKMGLGGIIGNGRQYWSWISLEDVLEVILRTLTDVSLVGPINVVSPRPSTNGEFTKTLGRVLNRPTIFPLPTSVARLALGEMADAMLLASARAEPARLKSSGYVFKHPDLESCLRDLLKK